MTDRVESLREVTLAIARAAAEENAGFADTLGTMLRGSLQRTVRAPATFRETLAWLERFEAETGEGSRGDDGERADGGSNASDRE